MLPNVTNVDSCEKLCGAISDFRRRFKSIASAEAGALPWRLWNTRTRVLTLADVRFGTRTHLAL